MWAIVFVALLDHNIMDVRVKFDQRVTMIAGQFPVRFGINVENEGAFAWLMRGIIHPRTWTHASVGS